MFINNCVFFSLIFFNVFVLMCAMYFKVLTYDLLVIKA